MNKPQRKYIKEKYLIFDAVADSILDQDEAEYAQESKELGFDVKAEAASVRAIINSAIKQSRQVKLNKAESDYKAQVALLASRKYNIPTSMLEKRALFTKIMSKRPDLTSQLTVQHRSFEQMSDTDIEEMLKELDQLGFFDQKNGE